jgi:hypothetical protein
VELERKRMRLKIDFLESLTLKVCNSSIQLKLEELLRSKQLFELENLENS